MIQTLGPKKNAIKKLTDSRYRILIRKFAERPTSLASLSLGDMWWFVSSDKCSLYREVQVQYEPRHEISNNMVCATIKSLFQPAHTRS